MAPWVSNPSPPDPIFQELPLLNLSPSRTLSCHLSQWVNKRGKCYSCQEGRRSQIGPGSVAGASKASCRRARLQPPTSGISLCSFLSPGIGPKLLLGSQTAIWNAWSSKSKGSHAGQGRLKVYREPEWSPASCPVCMEVVEKRGAFSCLLEACRGHDSYRWKPSSDFTDCQPRCEDEHNHWAFAGGATHPSLCKLSQATWSGLLLFKAVSDKVSSSLCPERLFLMPPSAAGWNEQEAHLPVAGFTASPPQQACSVLEAPCSVT